MKKRRFGRLAALVMVLACLAMLLCGASFDIPSDSWVMDEANILSAQTEQYVNERTKVLSDACGAQIGVATVEYTGSLSVEDYAYTCQQLDAQPQVGWLEVNVSCPNVHGGGMSFGTQPEAAAEVTRAVKAVTKKPVIIKLSPNVTDIVSIAKACEDAGADGISLINTMLGMRIDLKRRKPVIANTMGGFSGPAIFPVAVRMVYQVSQAVSIPVVGMGGVQSAEDVLEMMLAGATAVEVGAANLVNPFASLDIVNELPAAMEKYGINDLNEMIGGAHNG